MQHQKIVNLLKNTTKSHQEVEQKKCAEVNDNTRGTYNRNSQIKIKNKVLKSYLCDNSQAYKSVKGTITITGTSKKKTQKQEKHTKNKQVSFKN